MVARLSYAHCRQNLFETKTPSLEISELQRKLQDAASTPVDASSPAEIVSSDCSTLDIEQLVEHTRQQAYNDMEMLLQLGGRPRAQINLDPDDWNLATLDGHLIPLHQWNSESERVRQDLEHWQGFRVLQASSGRTAAQFEQYKTNFATTNEIYQPLDRGNKVDDWLEFYLYEHWSSTVCMGKSTPFELLEKALLPKK